MITDRSYQLTLEMSTYEAVEIAAKLRQLEELPTNLASNMDAMRDFIYDIGTPDGCDELRIIIKVRRNDK
jgi:hypothetical protein